MSMTTLQKVFQGIVVWMDVHMSMITLQKVVTGYSDQDGGSYEYECV